MWRVQIDEVVHNWTDRRSKTWYYTVMMRTLTFALFMIACCTSYCPGQSMYMYVETAFHNHPDGPYQLAGSLTEKRL